MIQKQKICYRCEKLKYIWKNIGGKPYCQQCSIKINLPKEKPKVPKKAISKVSEKRIVLDKIYLKLRAKFLLENDCCVAKLPGCTHCTPSYLTIQHLKGRVGDLYLATEFWITLCLNCHRWVNEHSKEAEALHLALPRLTI